MNIDWRDLGLTAGNWYRLELDENGDPWFVEYVDPPPPPEGSGYARIKSITKNRLVFEKE